MKDKQLQLEEIHSKVATSFLKVANSVHGDVRGIYAHVHIRVCQDVCMRVWR